MDKVQCDRCSATLSDRTALKRHLLAIHKRKLLSGSTQSAVVSPDELDALWVREAARRKRDADRRRSRSKASNLLPAAEDRLPPSTPATAEDREQRAESNESRVELQTAIRMLAGEASDVSAPSVSAAIAGPAVADRPATESGRVCRAVFLADTGSEAVGADEGHVDRPSFPTRDEPGDRQDALWSPRPLLSSTTTVVPPLDTLLTSLPTTALGVATSPVSDTRTSDSTVNFIYGVLSGQTPGETQMFGVGQSVRVDISLASFVLANPEVLSRAVLEQRSNPAALLTILASARELKVTHLVQASSAVAYGARALSEILALRFFEDEDPVNTVHRLRRVIAGGLKLPSEAQFYRNLVPFADDSLNGAGTGST